MRGCWATRNGGPALRKYFRFRQSCYNCNFLGGRKQRLDGFLLEHEQGGDRPQTGRHYLVAARRADPLDDIFAAQLLQIVRGLAGAVGGGALIAKCANLIGQAGGGEPVG